MNTPGARPGAATACRRCLRRSWLLAELSGPLDFLARDRARLHDVLALDDEELVAAVAGRRRGELGAGLRRSDAGERHLPSRVEALCAHDPTYPRQLLDVGAPRMLYALGGAARLVKLAAAPAVLIAGSGRASDYGLETARSIARGLAVAGITVVSAARGEIALAAQTAALEVRGRTLAVSGSGLGVQPPAGGGALSERVARRGCIVSELPCGRPGRLWGAAAGERTLARLSGLTVIVEAGEGQRELSPARLARGLGRTVAAVPGRVTSPLSAGTNALLMDGACLVRGPEDVLELLHPPSPRPANKRIDNALDPGLSSRLRSTLRHVGTGRDTPQKLMAVGMDLDDALLALSELELMGLLARGDGGRYVPRGLPPG
ncbi:MAG TPA: DNA-processing protein DprA [Solirubrobacteraceae bacterium]